MSEYTPYPISEDDALVDLSVPDFAFCTPEDVARRLGRDLTADETSTVAELCDAATLTILAAASRDLDWAVAQVTAGTVPLLLRIIAIEVVRRSMTNPAGLSSETETLGAYSHTARYREESAGGGLLLTRAEERLVRQVVYGRSSGTSMPATTLDQVIELAQTGELAEFPAE
jgi:hypothetical protein